MSDGYSFTLSEDAFGVVVELRGPGMPQHANGVHLMQQMNDWASKCLQDDGKRWYDLDAERIVGLLADAFDAGKRARSAEMRELLGEGAH